MFLDRFMGIARAAENDRVSLYPATEGDASWFVYRLSPGAEHGAGVVLENKGDGPLSVRLYPVDSLTTREGAFALKQEGEAKIGVGAWTSLSADAASLAAHERKTVPFSLSVPRDVAPGEYSGGIIAQEELGNSVQGGQVSIVSRVGVRIYETVPGALHPAVGHISVTHEWKDGSLGIIVSLKNDGNSRLSVRGTVRVRGLFPPRSVELPFSAADSQPGAVLSWSLPTQIREPPAGRYSVEVMGRYVGAGSEGSFSASERFYVYGSEAGYLALALVAVLVLVASRFRKAKGSRAG